MKLNRAPRTTPRPVAGAERSVVVPHDDRLRGLDARATVTHLFDVFVRSVRAQHPVVPLTDGRTFTPDQFGPGSPARDYEAKRRAAGPRVYRIFHEFLFPESRPPAVVGERRLFALLDRLDAY